MNIYMIQQEDEPRFWLGKSMEAALADAWDDYIAEQDIAGSDYEKARELYAQDILQSCTFIGELEQIKSKPSGHQWTSDEIEQIQDRGRMDFLERRFATAAENDYDQIVLRKSTTGRGLRLHHTRKDPGENTFPTVREAIDAAMAHKG